MRVLCVCVCVCVCGVHVCVRACVVSWSHCVFLHMCVCVCPPVWCGLVLGSVCCCCVKILKQTKKKCDACPGCVCVCV